MMSEQQLVEVMKQRREKRVAARFFYVEMVRYETSEHPQEKDSSDGMKDIEFVSSL